MAEDTFELNFELGPEPLKPQVKFRGGRWRDRKRAENTARRLASSRSAPDKKPDSDAQRLSKRRRLDEDKPERAPESNGDGRPETSKKSEPDKNDGHVSERPGRQHKATDPTKTSRQVVSRLFSYNPQQQTAADEADDWKAPQPTNAPLADVASFGSLTISSRLVDELAKMNLHRPTAIQQKVVPHLLSNNSDAFVQAETGSGKTFSYLLPVIHRVLLLSAGNDNQVHRDSGIFAIIISPTRELAKQVHTVLDQLLRPFPWLVSTAISGGESKKSEKARIRKGVNFLIATPGRLADHIDNTKALTLATTRWLILDEGDRLMELGFERDLEKIISALRKVPIAKQAGHGTSLEALPDRRVTVLCSATMRMDVQKLGEMSLTDATLLAADKGADDGRDEHTVHKAPAQLHQTYIIVPSKLRLVTLISHLRSVFSRRGRTMKAIIFMSCADSVDFHYELLRQPDGAKSLASSKDAELTAKTVCPAAYLTSAASPEIILHRMHGSLSQPTRTATLRAFSACEQPSVLISTDVSSRGLDIPSIDLVVEYDPAFSFADHIHRIGRTARAGRPGDAVLFLLPGSEEGYVEVLKSSASPSSLSYESVLQKGLMAKFEFPVETSSTPAEGSSCHERAEALQLHIEQRLLLETKLLELARNGYRSHIRAYATHVKDERVHFDLSGLHLGHAAKSFGLREAPGGIGAGIERKARKGHVKTSTGERKPARDTLMSKSIKLMAAADEFNIG
ncbi:hypothetical protein CDD80_3641 [Ophiocordyceps camponoti-rufipedis]|uniref:ATP-dependent RNA helicase n=1 Tax=Ophiocordyceps camponoti-rufipedis TaxID=2004952 RepID=A0A2C5Z1K8_9HYPO|nr:hypothetical protein CDD80_3641 [Ophiocordyceps camponoti-rufipedis]